MIARAAGFFDLVSADEARHPALIGFGSDDSDRDEALVAGMFEAMERHGGVGLAAPQIGMSSAFAVVAYKGERFVLGNPKLTKLASVRVTATEGCLSLPGRHFDVERATRVQVHCWDQHREERILMVEGWLARIFQHECDHLRGVLIDSIGQEVFEAITDGSNSSSQTARHTDRDPAKE